MDSTKTAETLGAEHDDGVDEPEETTLPPAVVAAQKGEIKEPGQDETDATAWLLDSDTPTPDEVEPTEIKLNVGTPAKTKILSWFVVPLPDAEFRKFRRLVTGNRRARRALQQGDVTGVDDWAYHLMVVAAATVSPDLRAAAEAKGVDVVDVLRHRFAAKPGLINQVSGIVSDISGMDEADAEVVAGNS